MPQAENKGLFSPDASILITGASSGIGAAIAEHLATYGGKIALLARRAHRLERLAARMQRAGARPLVLVGDVTDPASVNAAHARLVAEQGPPDVAFLNAGTGRNYALTDFCADHVRNVFDVNLFGAVNWLERLLPAMLERRSGILVGVSSLAAARGGPSSGAYSASKAALSILLESIRLEARGYDVQVSTVEPGFVRSELTAHNRHPMPFLMETADAARAICDGVADGRPMIRFPWQMAAAMRLLNWLPIGVYDRMAAKMLDPGRVEE